MDCKRLKELLEKIDFVRHKVEKFDEKDYADLEELLRDKLTSEQACGVISDGYTYDVTIYQYKCSGCGTYYYAPSIPKHCPICGRLVE